MNEQLPDGLQLAVNLLEGDRDAFVVCHRHPIHGLEQADAEIACEYLDAINAISAMQHRAADMAQQIEDLRFAAEAGGRRIAELEAERNTARGAVRELERQVFALQQQRDVLQTCLDRHQRDAEDPPGYLQDAVIRAAGLGALHAERDAAIKERDALRARLAEIEAQEPAAVIGSSYDIHYAGSEPISVVVERHGLKAGSPLYARPVPAQAVPDGWRLVKAGALQMVINALRRDAEEGRHVRGEMADELLNAAPEHKA